MEKISSEAKRRYAEKIKEYKQTVDLILAKAAETEKQIIELKKKDTPEGSAVKRLEQADQYLNLVSYYVLMNALSLSLLGIKNEGYLNDARKSCYRSIICLEEIVSPYVDVPYSEYESGVQSIDGVVHSQKYSLIRKLGFAIDSVVEGFGENSKWKWSFVELKGRYSVITKNLINLKTVLSQMDPRVEGYGQIRAHLELSRNLLQQSADRYREKYELSTLRIDDIKTAIDFLSALRRLHVLFGQSEESEVIKRKIDIWRAKMEDDQRKEEHAHKLERLKRK